MLDVSCKCLMFYINAWCFIKRLKVVPVSLSVLGRGSCSGKTQFILGKGGNCLKVLQKELVIEWWKMLFLKRLNILQSDMMFY